MFAPEPSRGGPLLRIILALAIAVTLAGALLADDAPVLGPEPPEASNPDGTRPPPEEISPNRFMSMTGSAVTRLDAHRDKGGKVRMQGFSDGMSAWLVFMAGAERRATQELMSRMKDLSTREDRLAELDRAIRRSEDYVKTLEESLERLDGDESGVREEEFKRLIRQIKYQAGLKKWAKYPMEGTR